MQRFYHILLKRFPGYKKQIEWMRRVYLSVNYFFFQEITRVTLDKKLKPILKQEAIGSVLEVAPQHLSYREYMNADSYKTLDINSGPGIDYVADLHQLTLSADMFDSVILTEVLEHLYNPAEAAKHIHPILKQSGKVIATTRFAYPYHGEPYDYFRFTEHGLREVFKDYSEVRVITHGNKFLIIWQFITSYRLLRLLCLFDRPIAFLFSSRSDNAKDPLGFIIIATK